MSYATDGKCHNAQAGTFGHECSKPAEWLGKWLGVSGNVFATGFCSRCKEHGDEASQVTKWEPYKAQSV